MPVLHAIDFEGRDGGERINSALASAASAGSRARVVVGPVGPDRDGEWWISTPVAVPSGVTLALEDCFLRLVENANCPMVVNRDPVGGDREIDVVGSGRVRLHGNPSAQQRTRRGRDVEIWMEERGIPLSLSTREAIGPRSVRAFEDGRAIDGDPIKDGMSGACGMEFRNVQGLRIENLEIGPTNLFGIHTVACSDIAIERITFRQDGSEPNQDGIGIIGPAHGVRIAQISGTCGDDAIGLHALSPDGGGEIVGVTISDVLIRNVWNSGLLRTEGTTRSPVRNVVATNLVMLDGEGRSEGHAAVKLGTTRRNWEAQMDGAAADADARVAQSAISISGLSVKDWVGPVIAIFAPIEDLQLSEVTGTHTGPLLVNFESAVRGCRLSGATTRVVALPEGDPYVGGMLQYSMAVNNLPASIREDERAAIVLDGDEVEGVVLRDVRVVLDPAAREQAAAAGARCIGLLDRSRNGGAGSGLELAGVSFPGFDAGGSVDEA